MKEKRNSGGKWDLDCLGPVGHERIVFFFFLEYLFIYFYKFIHFNWRKDSFEERDDMIYFLF